jgi:hypothetical protein
VDLALLLVLLNLEGLEDLFLLLDLLNLEDL